MKHDISYCGLNCLECGAYIATQNDDDEKRAEVADLWSQMFKVEIKPEAINCNGCHSTSGPIFGHCETCAVRLCGIKKEVENCAHCSDYGCEPLTGIHSVLSDAKKSLEKIRSTL